MKRILYICLILSLLVCVSGCGKKELVTSEDKLMGFELMGDCVTVKAFYHNVASYDKKAGSGLQHIFEKDREMWIQYTGIVELGVDLSKVKYEKNATNIKIFIPKAKIVSSSILVDEFDENSFAISSDGFFNKNKLTTQDSTDAIKVAQNNMKKEVKRNHELFRKAQLGVKNIIEQYLNVAEPNNTYIYEWTYE